MANKLIAIEPKSFPEYEAAVVSAGGVLAPLSVEVEGLVWTDYSKPAQLAAVLAENPQLRWVQLPFAGVDAFADVLSDGLIFTSAKGAYREPVAEHALALSLALMRIIPERVRAKTWGRKFADTLYETRVLIFGGGGITEELLKLLAPFRSDVRVVRKNPAPMAGASAVVAFENLNDELQQADLVILAAALTPETAGLFDATKFSVMKESAYLVNIARGPMVVISDLIAALEQGQIAGAALDVTDPEPLPDGHPLWDAKNIIITPHSADTKPMVIRLFSERLVENTKAFLGLGEWVGRVDSKSGY